MRILNTCIKDLNEALNEVNLTYNNNIIFKDLQKLTKNKGTFKVRLTVKNAHALGAKQNARTGRAIHAACWHVHGIFIDCLLKKGCLIRAQRTKINVLQDNWKDWDCGLLYGKASAQCRCR